MKIDSCVRFSGTVDKAQTSALNAAVGKNQHRWRQSIESGRITRVLDEAGERLKSAWAADQEHPKGYPTNTLVVFSETYEELRAEPGQPRKVIGMAPPPLPQPKSFSDLLDEKIIRAIFEDQNEGSYEDALQHAARRNCRSTWRKLLRAVDAAHGVEVGVEPPKPRVHFLHRGLLGLANLSGIGDMTLSGLVEFFDDLCPCGKQHNQDAIRKLKQRWAGQSRQDIDI